MSHHGSSNSGKVPSWVSSHPAYAAHAPSHTSSGSLHQGQPALHGSSPGPTYSPYSYTADLHHPEHPLHATAHGSPYGSPYGSPSHGSPYLHPASPGVGHQRAPSSAQDMASAWRAQHGHYPTGGGTPSPANPDLPPPESAWDRPQYDARSNFSSHSGPVAQHTYLPHQAYQRGFQVGGSSDGSSSGYGHSGSSYYGSGYGSGVIPSGGSSAVDMQHAGRNYYGLPIAGGVHHTAQTGPSHYGAGAYGYSGSPGGGSHRGQQQFYGHGQPSHEDEDEEGPVVPHQGHYDEDEDDLYMD